MAEKCRAGGAGIPAFFTATGAHTWVEEGKMPIKFKPGGMEAEIVSKPKEVKKKNYKKKIEIKILIIEIILTYN